jgi:hypothetical protein
MVDVGQRTDIDKMLEHSLAAWAELPQVEAEIDSWHQIEQITYVEQWTVQEDRLARLERAACDGSMTAKQRERYAALQSIVERNRPIITRLLES